MVSNYLRIEKNILFAITAELFIQLINSSFMLVQPLFMHKVGYADNETANFISFRFLGMLLFAIPISSYIKKHSSDKLFLLSGILTPTLALIITLLIQAKASLYLCIAQFLLGISVSMMQVAILPYILQNSSFSNKTAAISLSFTTWSIAGIFSGAIIAGLGYINPILFNEKNILLILSILGYAGIYFLLKISPNTSSNITTTKQAKNNLSISEYKQLTKALTPTLLIAIGAGLTIPFIGLFFTNTHNFSTSNFALLSFFTSILVVISTLFIPFIKQKIGYKKAIPITQIFAIAALILFASTEHFSNSVIAVNIAIIAYTLRQPLMNSASPMTSELVMEYIGKKNRELASGIISAIWSGSWFISAKLFQILRKNEFNYSSIFYITSALYIIAVFLYLRLIKRVGSNHSKNIDN